MQTPSFQSLLARDATREQLEEWCRARAQAVTVSDDLILCRVLGKYRMYALSRDYALTPHLALDGIWEPWVTMAIARHVKPGMRCLDVGACYGYYSLLMADAVGEGSQVDAWEPYHHELLLHNVNLNGLPIAVVPMALGPGGGDAIVAPPVRRNRLQLFNAGGVEVSPDRETLHTFERRVSLRAPMGLYDFIKIDVEGYERQVWEALRVGRYEHGQPLTVCLEFTPGRHEKPEEFLQLLQDDGFRLGTVGHDGTPRGCSVEEALRPDTGDFRMLWLKR